MYEATDETMEIMERVTGGRTLCGQEIAHRHEDETYSKTIKI